MKILLFGLILAFIAISCGSVESDKDIFKKGKTLSEQNNISEALSAFQQLLKEYPKSEFADSALFRMAKIYQDTLVISITKKESLEKAAEYYRQIYDQFPERKLAPIGLFMSGFVQANDLKDFSAATKTYNLFIQKYPDSELAVAAKEELDNMGLSPEEILHKNIARQK